MADTKISNLPRAEVLNGTEIIPIVQGDETRKIALKEANTYLESINLVNSDGEEFNLTVSNKTFYKLTWTGGNGFSAIFLPLASQSENRVYRFICDGTISANKYVKIKAKTGETIDGDDSPFTINRPYEGLQVWCDGTEWYIIQQKA